MMTGIARLLVALGLVLGLVACGDEALVEDGGIDDSAITDDAGADQALDDDAAVATPYRFVRIEDDDTDPTGDDPGADIDAVGLIKGSANEVYAGIVSACENASTTDNACANEGEILSAPDAFPNIPLFDECTTAENPYVSLGGEGGFVVVEMTADIEEGDTLNIYELGNCTVTGGGNTAKAEPISVFIGTSAAGPWTELTVTGEAPMYPITVPAL